MISDNIEYEINTQSLPSKVWKGKFFLCWSWQLFVAKGGSHLKKVSENETRMYTLCILNGKKLDTGHSSSPNSELWYCFIIFQDYLNIKILKFFENFELFKKKLINKITNMWWALIKFSNFQISKYLKMLTFFAIWLADGNEISSLVGQRWNTE